MIDVAIALGLIYLMLAGLVSGIHELIATALQQRGRMLVKGIESLLCGATAADANGRSLADEIMQHPMIAVLRDGKRLPSYVPAASFATALADTLVRSYQTAKPLFEGLPQAIARLPEGELKQSLSLLVVQARDDADRLQALLQQHFDEVMARVSGWYKRRSQTIILVISAFVAISLNVDSIAIVQRLARDSELTAQLVAQAQQTLPPSPSAAPADADLAQKVEALQGELKRLQDLRVPIGWSVDQGRLRLNEDQARMGLWIVVVGWVISALAASLGAPFWFDAISKLVSLRGAGTSPGASRTGTSPAGGATIVVQPAPASVQPAARAEPSGPANDFERARLTELDVEQLQRALGMPPEQVSAVLDGPTRTALRNWQQARGRPVTGVFDEDTVLAVLYPVA